MNAARVRKTARITGWILLGLFAFGLAQSTAGAVVVVIGAVVVAIFWLKRRERRRITEAHAVAAAARAAATEDAKRWWRELPFVSGSCSVVLSSVAAADLDRLYGFLSNLAENETVGPLDAHQLLQRVEHIGPQTVVSDVAEDWAIELKIALEERGAKVKIAEGAIRAVDGRREPIPERVRHEVWRRDGGQCVDCGSRERLEYDHIVAVSRGGASTARNIELRCETCNRRKGARI